MSEWTLNGPVRVASRSYRVRTFVRSTDRYPRRAATSCAFSTFFNTYLPSVWPRRDAPQVCTVSGWEPCTIRINGKPAGRPAFDNPARKRERGAGLFPRQYAATGNGKNNALTLRFTGEVSTVSRMPGGRRMTACRAGALLRLAGKRRNATAAT